VALSLYALLPILRSTVTGLATLDRQLLEIADVLGFAGWRRLARIELPLASVNIMAGVKTAAIWTVGTATLAAFIGGGGYGTLIVRGLALDDVTTILAGAIPAALMALCSTPSSKPSIASISPRPPPRDRPPNLGAPKAAQGLGGREPRRVADADELGPTWGQREPVPAPSYRAPPA
jgi:hypothetical protein